MTDDQDPTGMSHLLAGLKETGPMPDDLNDRIRASLASEQATRSEEDPDGVDAPDGPESTTDSGEGRDDAADRAAFWSEMDQEGTGPSRRSTPAGRWVLGIAAAAVLVMGVGGIFAIRGGDEGASDSAGSSAPSQTELSGGEDSEAAPSAEETPAFAVTDSGRTYTQSALGSEAGELYANPARADELKDSTALGTMSTAAGAKDCLSRLGSPDLQPVVIDVGYFGETPGLLIIAEPVPEGTPQAWAVTTGCEKIWDGPTDVSTGD